MLIHTVVQGEHIPGIAAQHGFRDFRAIWNHPRNAALKQERKNPNVLFPGDQVFIPDREQREELRPVDARHRFVLAAQGLQLRVKVVDLRDRAVDRSAFFRTGNGNANLIVPTNEVYEIDISPGEKRASLFFPANPTELARPEILMEVGSLDPETKPPGQQERLNNLGYFAGFSTTPDPDQFRWAVEEFQQDNKIRHKLKVTGSVDDPTADALAKEHGDKVA